MRLRGVCVIQLVGLLLCGCGSPTLPPPKPPDTPAASRQLEHGHLLLYPVGDPEKLLGRPVKVTSDGAWTIGDSRAPGCEVAVQREAAQYRVRRRVDLESLTAFSGGFGKLIGIEAGFGSANKADIDIENTSVLSAHTRGDCGDAFVDRVFVGTGRRKLLASSRAGASASLSSLPGAPAGGVNTQSEVVDETAWDSEQAYAFTFKQAGGDRGLQLKIHMQALVAEGSDVKVQFEATQPAYLVVYYLDSQGKGAVLWPSPQEPEPQVRPDSPAVLPSAAEQRAGVRVQAALSEPDVAARETLVAYAFKDRADFERLRPPAGAVYDDGAAHAARLSHSAESVPLERWSRALHSYVITPRKGPP